MFTIDNREIALIAQCKALTTSLFDKLEFTIKNLPIGDVVIKKNEDDSEDCIIIERKTIHDLAASIKDGRYIEQSYRLDGLNCHNHNIIYLIEGDLYRYTKKGKSNIDKQTLYSAIFSIMYFKGFSVMCSKSVEETAFIICNMTNKFAKTLKNRNPYYLNKLEEITHKNDSGEVLEEFEETRTDPNIQIDTEDIPQPDDSLCSDKEINAPIENNPPPLISHKSYCHVVKKVKKDNITVDNIGEIMLSQIPSVSSINAVAILSKFGTLAQLIHAISEDKTCLDDICTVDKNNKSRKISKRTIHNIIKFLVSDC